ncbi:MAG: hypothetical protein ACRDTH_29555 [Pseudonocardiaceae bacterium]
MAVVRPVPQAAQTVFVYPGNSATPGAKHLVETEPLNEIELLNEETEPLNETELLKEQPRITVGLLLVFIIAVVANLAIIAILANSGEPSSTAMAQAEKQPRPVPVALPAPANLATTFGEGRFLVGTDIAPGTYQTTGESGTLDCYWERLKDTRDATDSIIANNLGAGPATVTIDKSDVAFQTRWCNTWSKVS